MFETPGHESCAFCDYLSGASPCAFVTRGQWVSAFMNRAQYEKGALLLVPNHHVETILDLDNELMLGLFAEARRIARGLIIAFGAVGLNMFQNNGIRAGQTIPHYHIHLVPRYADSDSARIFREKDFSHTSIDDLLILAAELNSALVSEDAT